MTDSQPASFFDDSGQVELAQEMAQRAVQRFSTKTLRAALFPQHQGTMHQPDGYARAEGYCGDLMTFYLRIEEGQIPTITFTTNGCDATIASGEILASMVADTSLKEAQQVTPADLLTALDGLPPNHAHCAALAVETLQTAIESYLENRNS